jgi:hypothetical protein
MDFFSEYEYLENMILYTSLTYNCYYPYLFVVQIFSLVYENLIRGSVKIYRMLKGSKDKLYRQTHGAVEPAPCVTSCLRPTNQL